MKLLKRKYLHGFTIIVIILALVRCAADVVSGKYTTPSQDADSETTDAFADCPEMFKANSVEVETKNEVTPQMEDTVTTIEMDSTVLKPYDFNVPATDDFKRHKVYGVRVYKEEFPDSNDLQIAAAQKYGVSVVQNRADAEKRKGELTYVGVNPYYHVGKLSTSIPYLVPRANLLLQDISKAFRDSLFVKGIPMHQIIVTSLLRTEEDVAILRRRNRNASENSCHRFGTTFDIAYNHYVPFHTTKHEADEYPSDKLKMVLAEVLRDMRQAGRCYVKYEVKQSCFHITTR